MTIVSPWNLQLLLVTSLAFDLVRSQTEVSVSSSTSTFDATLTCSMVENGTYLKDPTSCNTWIQCIDDEPIYGTCPSGLFYNRDTNECVTPDTIKCYATVPCATIVGNGFVADPNSCNGYYYCYNGQGTHGQCSEGLNYNPGTEDCIRDFVCPPEPDPLSWCNIIPDGEFFSDPQSCQGYHMCENYVLQNGSCPDGYYFSAFDSVCDYKNDVKCSIPEPHPNLPGDGICQTAGQFVSDNKTCAGYYYCQETSTGDFILFWGKCAGGRFFDPVNGGECVNRQEIACSHNRCEGMGATAIQLANAPDDGCVGYLICQDGEEIGSGLCPSDEEYYDEVTQRCTTSVIAYPACLVTATTTSTSTPTSTTNPQDLDEATVTGGSSTIEESNSVES